MKISVIIPVYNCELYVVKENGDVNTPSGQLSAWILMSLAEYYIKNLKYTNIVYNDIGDKNENKCWCI